MDPLFVNQWKLKAMIITNAMPSFFCRPDMALFYYTGITIGFEYETYAFREDRAHLLVQDEVFIIKQNNQMSELTYNITIDFFSGSALICGSCYVQSLAKHHEVITPIQQRIPVNFRIFPDDVPEGIETFTVQIRNNDPATNFTNYPGEATISIFDDYGRYQYVWFLGVNSVHMLPETGGAVSWLIHHITKRPISHGLRGRGGVFEATIDHTTWIRAARSRWTQQR